MRESPSLLRSDRRIANKAILLLQQALDAHHTFLVAFKVQPAVSPQLSTRLPAFLVDRLC
jgi:hypothetical protein